MINLCGNNNLENVSELPKFSRIKETNKVMYAVYIWSGLHTYFYQKYIVYTFLG